MLGSGTAVAAYIPVTVEDYRPWPHETSSTEPAATEAADRRIE